MIYANYATSYRISTMGLNQGDAAIPGEGLKSYTLGISDPRTCGAVVSVKF